MRTKYLVTGAAGNLGSCIVGRLASRGDDVRALVLPNDPLAARLPQNVERCEGNVCDPDSLESFFAAPADTEFVVIHTAAIVTTYPEFDRRVYDVNVEGTKHILAFCLRRPVKKLIYVSSSSAIPELPGDQVMQEVSDFDPEKVIGFYAKTKAEASRAVMEAARGGRLDASLVFPTAICGPQDYAMGHLTHLIAEACAGKLPAGIVGGFDAVDVRDLANGVLLCADRGRPGEGYLLGGRFITVREILHEVHLQTGSREVRQMVPLWLANAAVPLCEVYYRLRHQKPVFTKFALYNLTRNNNYSSEKACRELGYSARPFQETISDTLRWLKEDGLIRFGRRRIVCGTV